MIKTKDIRVKIASIKNTQKITKAMEMVAASKMCKAQERVDLFRPYVEKICRVINHITLSSSEYKHAYLNKRKVQRVGCIVVSTDHGLVGSLNINLFKKLLINIKLWSEQGIKTELALIGRKALYFFSLVKIKIIAHITDIGDSPKLSELIKPVKIMLQAYDKHHLDSVYIANNKFVNKLTQLPQIIQILPLPVSIEDSICKSKIWDYIYEPDAETLLNVLLCRYIESKVYYSVIENLASEQAARMIAMKAATDNGSNLIKDLQIIYNKVRQTNITQEIAEIISGASSI